MPIFVRNEITRHLHRKMSHTYHKVFLIQITELDDKNKPEQIIIRRFSSRKKKIITEKIYNVKLFKFKSYSI